MKKRKAMIRRISLFIAAVILGVGIYNWNARTVLGNQLPMPFGVGFSVVLSGSMEPLLSKGDLVIVQEAEEIQIGDVLIYQSGNILIIHRLTAIEGDRLIMQGDANNLADAPISRDAVKGKMKDVIPGAGTVVQLFRQPIVIAVVLALALLLIELSWRREKEQDKEELEDIRQEIQELLEEIRRSE